MDKVFDKAWELLMLNEGGGAVVDDPHDPGGLTKWGISQRSYPDTDIAALTEDGARELTRQDYWTPSGCNALPPWAALALLDSAFNQGRKPAIAMLQRAVGVLPDGVMGPDTITAVERAYPREALGRFLAERAVRYCGGKPLYVRGWMRRLFVTHGYILGALNG